MKIFPGSIVSAQVPHVKPWSFNVQTPHIYSNFLSKQTRGGKNHQTCLVLNRKNLRFKVQSSILILKFSHQPNREKKKIPTMHFPESPNNKKTQDSKPQSLHFLHSPTSQTDKGNPNSRRSDEGERKKPNKPLSSSSQTKTPHSNSQLLSIFLTFSNQPNRFKKTPIL